MGPQSDLSVVLDGLPRDLPACQFSPIEDNKDISKNDQKQDKKIIDFLTEKAQKDFPQSAYQLGQLLFFEKDACKMLLEIVELPVGVDCPIGQRDLVHTAMYNLARAYYQGFGVPQSDKEAIR
ncbi:unnamed protein product [Protopolystoma xenopodis]|uniref:Uncharacterized protein n=1 Tax=Protopolystoma xenopodis TaxID=117903 RepID=A0A3S5FDZ9_9PLAT|nr:unnamed protein product [Protopolystoma xenopodis]